MVLFMVLEGVVVEVMEAVELMEVVEVGGGRPTSITVATN